MLTLYFLPGARSMALHEVGAVFDAVPVSFAEREHQGASFRAISPELLIDGRRLTEVFPAAQLLPDDIEADAQVVWWTPYRRFAHLQARRRPAGPRLGSRPLLDR